jgi:hypothetical membrane protein
LLSGIESFIKYKENIFGEKTVLLRNLSTGMYLLHAPLMDVYGIIAFAVVFPFSNEVKCLIIVAVAFLICMISYSKFPKIGNYLK